MVDTVSIDTFYTELLANEIVAHLKNTEAGHCARVDFLNRAEALKICHYMERHQPVPGVLFHILTSDEIETKVDTLFITTDKAIELRNRKLERLCLFIPADVVDAAYSSIANSFALIDGRALQALVLKQVQAQLSSECASIVRAVFAKLRGLAGVSDEQRLDFVLAAFQHMQADDIKGIGLELWRVGLIADGGNNFVSRLGNNHNCVVNLSRPSKIGATTRERIQSIKVDAPTTAQLSRFFHGRSLNDVRSWSRELNGEEDAPTFEQWVFPKTDPSDLRTTSITPFVNARGEVERYCHLHQPDGAKGILLARYGARETLIVRWKTDPELPKDLDRWRVGIVPADSENGFDDSLDERNVIGKRRTVTIKLDMDFDEPPDYAVCVRIMPLSSDGNEIINSETEKAFCVDSHEFFLTPNIGIIDVDPPRKSLRTVPTLALGRFEVAVDLPVTTLVEDEPEWIAKDLEYFRVRLNERRVLNIGLSNLLLTLERQVLANPRSGGAFLLEIDEIRPVDAQQISAYPLLSSDSDAWSPFWRARDMFFKRLKQSEIRAVVEVVEWTQELAAATLRYAQAYRELIDDLTTRQVPLSELREALSLDTLLVKNTRNKDIVEEALVILPTHPLRAAWFASYTQLLHEWESKILSYHPRERKQSIDLQALRLLVPTNVPAFAYHAASTETFAFFQNMRFFHGVALPAGVPDPHRRYGDLTILLDTGIDQGGVGDIQPDRLAEHLARFHQLHPYVKTLATTLINPDRGDFFAEALQKMLLTRVSPDEAEQIAPPAFRIISYVEDGQKNAFQALEKVRQQQSDLQSLHSSDHFLPGLTVVARKMSQLEHARPPEAHIAVITDFTRPAIIASTPGAEKTSGDTSSFALYGLVNRFISQFTSESRGLLWRHGIVTEGIRKPSPHPAGLKYTETLMELHASLLRAGGALLGGEAEAQPVLEVCLEKDRRDLLELLHVNTNWVITLDRFFTLDYYDSPNQPGLDDVARKYVLDYSPDFTEGLGHRMMVTTSWHEEIGSLLYQAMHELGFASIEQSVSRLLHHLKMISGRLALEALESPNGVSAAVGLGVVTAWLQKNKKLRQAVLVPVDIYPRLFSLDGTGRSARGEKRCDLVLISLRRNIVDATFIEVKWRRGNVPFEGLAQDMVLQMKGSALAMESRFFNERRVDGALQRSYLANVLRFYFERSRRYGLFDSETEASFLEHVTRLEKNGLDFRASYEGYIVCLESEQRKPLLLDEAKVTILTARDFEHEIDLFPTLAGSPGEQSGEQPSFSSGEELAMEAPQEDEPEQEEMDAVIARGFEPAIPFDVTAKLPDVAQDQAEDHEIIIPLGEALGERIDWNPGVKGSPHLFILGIPGQGKSWAVTRLLSELGKQQVPALVLDFHGQFAESDGAFVKAVHPGVLDAASGLPFSPFECTHEVGQGGWMANALAVAEIFAYVAGLGDMQKDVVYTAVRDAYKARGFADGNDTSLEYPTLRDVLRRIEQYEQARHVTNVTARCRPLLEMELFRPAEQSVDLLSLVRSGLVIDLHNLFAESLQMAAGAFVLRKIYKDMFHWGYAKKLRLAIVLDEAHRLAKDITLPKLMKEGRKFGISVIVASQGLGDFHPDVLSNAGTKMIFRMNYPESRKVSGFIRSRQGQDLAERIEQLSVGSAYIQTPEMMYGAAVQMYPLEE